MSDSFKADSQPDKSPTDDSIQSSIHSDSYSEHYFDALYEGNSDPWHYQTRWYEKRKRDICLALLPQPQYQHAIELGCGNGVFSELLAPRCQSLVSLDGNTHAVALAMKRLADLSHIKVIQGVIPNALSAPSSITHQSFNLIVISEILYYLSPDDIDSVIDWIGQHLALDGTLLCCHWRYAIEGFEMTGETVHERLYRAFGPKDSQANSANNKNAHHWALTHQSRLVDSDFLLDVWQNSTKTVAMQENLV